MIRQGITGAIATKPHHPFTVHVTEKLNRIKRVQQEIASNEGRIASIADLARELGISEDTSARPGRCLARSLDTHVGREQDTQLGDLIEDGHATPEQTSPTTNSTTILRISWMNSPVGKLLFCEDASAWKTTPPRPWPRSEKS